MSHAPRRISSKRVGSKLYSVDGPAHDRVEPDVRQLLALEHPRLAAVVPFDDTRRALGELRREPALERVRRLDDVVVDRDHGEARGRPARARATT